MRQYRPLSSHVVKSGEVLAGEKVMMPSLTLLSRNSLVTPDEAAPIMAETPSLWSLGTVVSNALLSASPESPKVTSTVMPAAASLTSLTASWTPASSGGPRKARLPVWGRTVPSLRVRSSAAGAEDSEGSEVPPPPAQPERTRALTPAMARPPITVRTREREAVPREKTLMLLLAVYERGPTRAPIQFP